MSYWLHYFAFFPLCPSSHHLMQHSYLCALPAWLSDRHPSASLFSGSPLSVVVNRALPKVKWPKERPLSKIQRLLCTEDTLGNCFFTKWLLCVSFFDPDILIQSLHNCRIHNSTLASKQTSRVFVLLFCHIFVFRVMFFSSCLLFIYLCILPRSRIFLNCLQDISRYQLLCIKQRAAVRHIEGLRACYQQH